MNSKRCHRGVGQNEAFSPQFDQSRVSESATETIWASMPWAFAQKATW